MEINFCPYCGLKIQADYNFCPKCGAQLPRESQSDYKREIDEFFDALEHATEEEKNEFFQLLEQDLKRKGQK